MHIQENTGKLVQILLILLISYIDNRIMKLAHSIKSAQIYLFFFIPFITACTQRKDINTSQINLSISIERFDQSMDSLTSHNIAIKHALWQKKYGQFYMDYVSRMLMAGNLQDTAELFDNYRKILQNRDFKALKKATAATFKDLSEQEKQLTQAFKHVKYYFPQARVPRIIAFFSGFTVQSPINTDYIGVGLDMFLGSDSKFYPALIQSIPRYISQRFTPENIVPRTMETYIRETLYPEPNSKTPNLLSLMIYNGKVLYLMDKMMPDVTDSLKIGYTRAQLEWANAYEKDIWAWFLEEHLLYETDYYKIQKHLGEAPFTPELGTHNQSAPKLGIFLGWQIVKKYMKEHPDVTLPQLLQTADAQKFLKDARYKGLP